MGNQDLPDIYAHALGPAALELGHRLYTPYGYETRKHHQPYAGFTPPYYILRPFTANSSLQNFIHIIPNMHKS